MNVFYMSLVLALLLIAAAGMGYLHHGKDSVVKRRHKLQHRFERSRHHG